MADEPEAGPLPEFEEEEGGPVKSFLEHLEDLRWVLIKSVVALALGMLVILRLFEMPAALAALRGAPRLARTSFR